MRYPDSNCLADKDAGAVVEGARAERGPIVAGWLARVLGRQCNSPGPPSPSQPGIPSGRWIGGFTWGRDRPRYHCDLGRRHLRHLGGSTAIPEGRPGRRDSRVQPTYRSRTEPLGVQSPEYDLYETCEGVHCRERTVGPCTHRCSARLQPVAGAAPRTGDPSLSSRPHSQRASTACGI
jgi:hypothetical protein